MWLEYTFPNKEGRNEYTNLEIWKTLGKGRNAEKKIYASKKKR